MVVGCIETVEAGNLNILVLSVQYSISRRLLDVFGAYIGFAP
jgi:hypothetical protein